MKSLLFLLCSLFSDFLMAQDCRDHLLMQQGVQLEYELYWPKRSISNSTGKPASRLVFVVDHVQDSAGSTRSTIIKSAMGVFTRKKWYDKKVVLQCDGQNLVIPFDFYLYDSLYAEDVYPNEKNIAHPYFVFGFKPLSDTIAYTVPLALDCIVSLPEFKKHVVQVGRIGYYHSYGCKTPDYFTQEFYFGGITLEGREMITTPAGTFACYKFAVKVVDPSDASFLVNHYLYYNKEIGLVKSEDPGRTIELVSIRK